jgi:D-arabinose 1-dehydrogenase-like Zn-dependent alcohol dehydrogenase
LDISPPASRIELPRPSATGRDLLVEVRAVSVNPVDYKVRASAPAPEGAAKVIGWDAAGIVVEAGPQATLFKVAGPAGETATYEADCEPDCKARGFSRACEGRESAAYE